MFCGNSVLSPALKQLDDELKSKIAGASRRLIIHFFSVYKVNKIYCICNVIWTQCNVCVIKQLKKDLKFRTATNK